MDCSYCYESYKKAQSISYDVIDNIIDFIVEQNTNSTDKTVSVITHGGEPLIEFDKIKHFIEKLNTKIDNVRYIVTTNATLLTDTMFDFFVEHYSEISISIDGTRTAHDANRIFANGQGTYDIVVKNAKKLMSRHNDIKARMTINPQTVSSLYESVKHLLDLGFTTIVPVADAFSHDWTEENITTLFEQGKLITDYVKSYPEPTNVGLINDALSKRANAPCNGGTSTFSIDTDGTIYPCIVAVGISEFIIGNVHTGINTSMVQEILEWDNIEIPSCVGCSRYDYCNTTRCRIINKVMCGDLHTPSATVCSIENMKVRISEYYMTVFPSSHRS
jgi:uncharacterized protein